MPLFSQVTGDPKNPTLVFLHGFLGNTNDWNAAVELLKNDFHCVCIDLPGHGLSVSSEAPLDNGFNYCHQQIKQCLGTLRIKKFSFVGYSLGGRIAVDYARTQDDINLQSLILESSHTGLNTSNEKNKRFNHDLNWAKRFAGQNITDSLYEWYEQAVFNYLNCQEKDITIHKRSDNYGVYLANMLLATSLSKQHNSLPFLQKTKLPVSYCFGEKDNKFKDLAATLDSQTDIKVTVFSGSGHNIHQQDPLQYSIFIKQHFIRVKDKND